jgi:alcohol dehydrogenase YqhD (iron-dependent ADH family)
MLKRAATGDALRPVFSVLNPEFTYTLPAYQTACGAVDMFAHVVERYFTPSKGVGISDELCEGVMRCIVKESVKALAEPEDYDARANLMWAGTVAHTNICGAGRIQDWASHGIEHELSALYDCAHGAGLAVVMPAWMEYVMKADVSRFARFASEVFGVGADEISEMAAEGIRRYREWLKSLGMPTTFAELGAKEEDIPALVAKLGLRGNTLGGFVQLDDTDVTNIFRLAVR